MIGNFARSSAGGGVDKLGRGRNSPQFRTRDIWKYPARQPTDSSPALPPPPNSVLGRWPQTHLCCASLHSQAESTDSHTHTRVRYDCRGHEVGMKKISVYPGAYWVQQRT